MSTRCRQLILAGLLLFVSRSPAQLPGAKSAPGEFPAISMMPPGTVLEGIKLPRYEGARVTSLIQAKIMRVLTRNEVDLDGLFAELYDERGFTTTLQSPKGHYDFRSGDVRSSGRTDVSDTRFRAQGQHLYYSTTAQRGHLRGPVRTILSLNKTQSKTAPKTSPTPARP